MTAREARTSITKETVAEAQRELDAQKKRDRRTSLEIQGDHDAIMKELSRDTAKKYREEMDKNGTCNLLPEQNESFFVGADPPHSSCWRA